MKTADIDLYISVGGPEDCHPWTKAKTVGYGCARIDGRTQYIHRIIWERSNGPVPDGLVVDHTCHNADPSCVQGNACPHRACQNVRHMELTTRGNNRRRAPIAGRAKIHAAKTHCINGHPFAGSNLRISATGARVCKTCAKRRHDAHRAKTR